jgi:DNA-binding NarL/FixJ family response regulator
MTMATNAALSVPAADAAETPQVGLVGGGETTRARVRELLRSEGLSLLLEADTIEQLASDPEHRDLDAIVIRLGRARGEILDAFSLARSRFAATPIVGLWPNAQRSDDRRALKTGIDGLLQEEQIESALVPTIHAVCAGIVCFPRGVTLNHPRTALSAREKQVLGMLIMGFTNAEIGRRLYLAESTVKSHLSSAYLKLGVRSRKDAAALILDPDAGLGTGILALQAG